MFGKLYPWLPDMDVCTVLEEIEVPSLPLYGVMYRTLRRAFRAQES